ncbi:cupin domain-containing protein [Desertibacillus haloalkaliphilus]|nr:cupin domain-containing protein [Desertibacillus haloalkaliphilus]
MYYLSNTYPYPYYVNAFPPQYRAANMATNHNEQNQAELENVIEGIKRESTAVDLYQRLSSIAPDPQHKHDILHALEGKRNHLNEVTNLYFTLTGKQPVYQIDKVPFQSYREGLQKAYNLEVEGYEEDYRSCLMTQHPQLQPLFLSAIHCQQENASRLRSLNEDILNRVTDYGSEPFVVDIEEATKQNTTFRTALWTGTHLQVTLMSIGVGEDIGLEIHPHLDQFIRIEEGQGIVQMGDQQDRLDFQEEVFADYAIIIPAGKWHNLTNTGDQPIKLYSIYAPPQHPYGTVHETKAIAMAAEENHHN